MENIKLNINYNSFFKNSISYIVAIFLGYLIDVTIFAYLPKTIPSNNSFEDIPLSYKRFNIQNSFSYTKSIKQTPIKKIKKEYKFLSNIILVAIYAMDNDGGFTIVREKGKQDTNMLSKNDIFKGYRLDKIFAKYVIFVKNNKEYKLSMLNKRDDVKYKVITQIPDVIKEDDMVSIKRDTVDSYINNFDKIWDDIAIDEIKTSSGIDGFKIKNIKKNSIFDKLGLKKNDIIKEVNNIKLKSYNDAFKIYKKIDKIKTLNMIILRNHKQKEITYEIK